MKILICRSFVRHQNTKSDLTLHNKNKRFLGTDEVSEKATLEKQQTKKFYQNNRERTKNLIIPPFKFFWFFSPKEKNNNYYTN